MEQSQARQAVLVSMFVTGGVVTYDLLQQKEQLGPDDFFRAVWSLALLFLLLAMLADTLPELAGPFALLVALAVVMGRKGVVSAIVSKGSKPPAH